LWIVDFEYCHHGDRAWDLANVIAFNGLDTTNTNRLLRAYGAWGYTAGGGGDGAWGDTAGGGSDGDGDGDAAGSRFAAVAQRDMIEVMITLLHINNAATRNLTTSGR
jgi:thiamine kinase-like enzyme